MSPVVEAFFAGLAVHGDVPALKEPQRELSYQQLLHEVEARVSRLHQAGAVRLALALDNGIDWVLWDLACLRAGLPCVPLPSFFSASQQQHVLDSAGVDTLICADAEQAVALGFEGFAADGLAQRTGLSVSALPVGTLKITYTSGTTGQPKGVCLDGEVQLTVARSLWQASLSCQVERHLCVLPLATLLENIAGIYAPLMAGAVVELRPLASVGLRGASQFDLPRFIQTLNEVAPHSLILLPQLLLALVTAAERGLPIPQSLRFIAVGGGRVAVPLLERAQALGLPVFEGYGLSECASVVCLNRPKALRAGTVGIALEHVELRLAEDGEVLVRGAQMLGYLGEPGQQGDWLATGDLGHFDGPYLVLHGRKKNQFITAYGRNVNPEWVEAELVQQLPIAQAWLYGEALPANLAVLSPRFAHCSDADLQAAVDAVNVGLPDYARVHQWIRAAEPFSAENGLATSNGRLRRPALLDFYRRAIDERVSANTL